MPTSLPYSVNLWGSKPGTNDDCWTGADYATLAEARAAYDHPETISDYVARSIAGATGELWLMLDGPDSHDERQLRKANRRAQVRERAAERHERAMEAGMAGGCDAYNDAMGWGS